MNKRAGFTLIELLVTITLLGVVSVTIYSSFASGLRVWGRLAQNIPEEDLSVFFEKVSRELQNTFAYSEIPFKGDGGKCSFTTVITTSEKMGADLGIGRVTYFEDPSAESIGRMQENLSQIFEEKGGSITPVLNEVSALSFRYYGYRASESRYNWDDEWESSAENGKLPLAVQVIFNFDDGKEIRNIVRTIQIPIGE